ncbi:cystatin-like [Mya arenaria]|uniref:cystatin-like n=1 Tax=Mya arenaria TaxID=6604 RepID=UPI0022E1F60F|nr:cystatin-like [Mya arenaria]
MNTLTFCVLAAVSLTYAMSQGVPGGASQIGTDDVEVQAAADFAIRELGSEYSLVELTKASRQVVAGSKHILEANVRRDMADGSKKFYTCTLETVTAEWKGYKELTKMCCDLTQITPASPVVSRK